MTRRRILMLCLIVVAALGVATWVLRRDTPPSCSSEPVLNATYAALHDRYQLNSIFLNDIRTVHGGWFSHRFECEAEVTTIRGNQDLADMPWRSVHYSVLHINGVPDFAVEAELGGPTPFVRQKPSWWQELISGH